MVTTPCAVTLGSPWWSGTGTWIAPDAGPGFQLVTVRFKSFAGTVLGSASTQVKLIPELQASIVVPGINSAVSSMSPSGELFFATSTSSQVSLFAVRGSSIVDAGVLVAPGAPGSLAFPSGRPTFSASTTNQGPFVMELTGQQLESQGAPNDGWVFAQSLPLNFTYPAPELFAVADGGLFALVRTNIVADPAQNSIELYRRTDAGWRAANSSDGGFLSLARGLRTRLGSYQGSPLAYFTFPDGGQQVGALHFTGNLAEQDGTPNDGWEFLGSPLSFSEPIGVLAHTLDAQGRPTLLAMGSGFDAKTWVSRFDGSWQPIGLGSIVDASPNGADLLGLPDGGFLAAIAARRPTLSDAVTVYQYTGDLTETEAVPHDGWIQLTLPTPIVSPRLHRNPVTGEVLLVGVGLAAPGQNGVLIYRLP